jgi:hypothetical protein
MLAKQWMAWKKAASTGRSLSSIELLHCKGQPSKALFV